MEPQKHKQIVDEVLETLKNSHALLVGRFTEDVAQECYDKVKLLLDKPKSKTKKGKPRNPFNGTSGKILKYLEENPGPHRNKDLAIAVSATNAGISIETGKLIKEGLIQKEENGYVLVPGTTDA